MTAILSKQCLTPALDCVLHDQALANFPLTTSGTASFGAGKICEMSNLYCFALEPHSIEKLQTNSPS